MAASTVPAYAVLRQRIQADKAQRINDHQRAVATSRRMAATPMALGALSLNLLAQGDSWFDYPLPILDPSDVMAHLKHIPGRAPLVLSLAHHGEAMEDMLGLAKLHELMSQLQDPASGPFDAILFSGGGNDLAGNQFRLWLQDAPANMNPAQGLNASRVGDILGIVQAGYEDLIQARDKLAPGVPIFAHSYDFAIPDGRGVCNVGPWLKPGLDDRGWSARVPATAVVAELLKQFAQLLDKLEQGSGDFVHVRTQGTLASGQWANELHPTPDGFAAITAKFVDALQARFPGRI
jgi:hypothetical protein